MKVIIAGSRTIEDGSLIEQAVQGSGFAITEVVSGCAPGVDRLGARWARKNKVPVALFPAQWYKNGQYDKRAGLERNIKMAEYADALIAIWDGNSPGTAHMIGAAKKAKLKFHVFNV